jgi:hypothetical protein
MTFTLRDLTRWAHIEFQLLIAPTWGDGVYQRITAMNEQTEAATPSPCTVQDPAWQRLQKRIERRKLEMQIWGVTPCHLRPSPKLRDLHGDRT